MKQNQFNFAPSHMESAAGRGVLVNKRDRRFHGLDLSLRDLIKLKAHANRLFCRNQTHSQLQPNADKIAKFHGRGMDFSEVRRYQVGDDIRCMDWRVTARTGKNHTKLFQEEKEQPIYLILNLSNTMQFGTRITFKSIVAVQIAAILAWYGVLNRDRVGGIIHNSHAHYRVKPEAGSSAILPLLKKILELNQTAIAHSRNNNLPDSQGTSAHTPRLESSSHKLLASHRHSIKNGSKLFFIDDFIDFNEPEKKYISRMAKQNQIYFFHVHDILEAVAPKPDYYPVSDGTHIFSFDSSDREFQAAYRSSFERQHDQLGRYCTTNRIFLKSVRTDMDIIDMFQGIIPP